MKRAGWAAMGMVLALASAAQAQTAPKFHAIEINDEALMALDLSTVERRGNHAVAWFVLVSPEGQAFRYMESRTEFDCVGRRQRQISERIYGDDHRLIVEDEDIEPWAPIKSPSVGENLLLAACDPDKIEAPELESPDVPTLVDKYLMIRADEMSKARADP